MKEQGISNKVTEAWSLEDFYIKVNDTEICGPDLIGFEAIYGGISVPAEVQFIDSKGLTTGNVENSSNIGVGGFVEVGYTTALNCDFRDQFVITKVITKNNSKNQKLVTLKLEDTETRNMKSSFVSKGYPNKKFTDVISEHFEEIGNTIHQKLRKFEIISPKDEKPVNITVPANTDFFTYFNKEMKEKGFDYIKDKTKSYLVHNEFKEFDKLSNFGDLYEFDTNPFSFSRIVQFNMEGFNSDAILDSFPVALTSIDHISMNSKDSKDGLNSKISIKDPKENVKTKSSGVNVGELATKGKGIKQGEKQINQKQYFETLSNAQKCSIWVPGRTDNMIGRKINASFPRPVYLGNEDDKIFSGEWEVYAVRDKVIGAYFMQEMFLRRPGGTNK